MAIYTPEQVGIKPPPGGFQTGGWYNSRQYWNGTFGDPGAIHQQSNQVGAGQAVSAPVVAATNVAQGLAPGTNEAYIASQRSKPLPSGVPGSAPIPTGAVGSLGEAGMAGGGGGSIAPISAATINLPEIYQKLYESSGISDIERDFSDKTKRYNEAVANIKDNPYLSEARMEGRLRKLDERYNADTQAIKNDIATRKADIETQLNLQTKQFDINSDAAKTAFSQFQSLLEMGALNNLDGDAIANITRSTGISSSMIQSAISAKNSKDKDTQLIQYDDGSSQGFAIIDKQTGEIISTQKIASSKPKAAGVTATREAEAAQNEQNLIGDVQRGATLKDVVAHYGISGGLSIDDIYHIYNQNSPYGSAGEDIEDVKQGKFNY